MDKKKLTKEKKLKNIKTHKKVAISFIIIGTLMLVARIIIINVYPDWDNKLISNNGIGSVTFFLIFSGIIQLFINKNWVKNPESYPEPPDERAREINKNAMSFTFCVYILLLLMASFITAILEMIGIVSWLVPTILFGNFILFLTIFMISCAVMRKKF